VEALVVDLESVDAVEEAVRPLRELAAELRPLARTGVPGGRELERLRDLALAVLRAFAAPDGQAGHPGPAPGPAPGPGRDPAFWRR
jgi:hypothetical protein